MTTFTGPAEVQIYRAITVKHGLKLYKNTGIKPNRAYTPTAMMRVAKEITGAKLKARDYEGAIKALDEWIEKQKGA